MAALALMQNVEVDLDFGAARHYHVTAAVAVSGLALLSDIGDTEVPKDSLTIAVWCEPSFEAVFDHLPLVMMRMTNFNTVTVNVSYDNTSHVPDGPGEPRWGVGIWRRMSCYQSLRIQATR